MGQNWQIDPVTRDYVLVNGSPAPTDAVEDSAYFILKIPMGNWAYAEDDKQGSELWRFVRAPRTRNTEKLFASRVLSSLNSQMVATGKAREVRVSNIEATRDGTSNQIEIEPNTSQLSAQLKFNPL